MLNFENAKVLSYSVENKFFGDSFRYGSAKNLSIQGSLYNLTNQSGIAEIWSGISGVISSANDYDDIQLRGVSFGHGRIDSISFNEGLDVRQKDFSVTLTIFDSGNLFNMTGSYYSGLDLSHAHEIEQFSENFSFNVDEEQNYTYDQSVSCKFTTNGTGTSSIDVAKNFTRSLFQSSPPFGFFTSNYSGFYNEPGKRYYRETYNLISNECSFTESFRRPSTAKGNYSARYGYQIETDDRGITTVQETTTITSLVEPLSTNAETAYSTEIAGAFARCQAEFSGYAPAGAASLNTPRMQLQKRTNTFEGTTEFVVTYSNDPTLQYSDNYTWEYSQEIRRDDCVTTVSERGRIHGMTSDCTYANRYANALAGYSTIKAGIETRLNAFALSAAGVTQLRQVGFSEELSQYKGEIAYSTTYTDALADTATTQIRKIESEIADTMPVALVNKFVAFGFGGRTGKEVIQPANIATPGERAISVKVFGKRGVARSILLDAAKTFINTNSPSQTDPFVTSCGYTYDVNTNTVSAQTNWTFFNDWAFTEVDV